MKVSLNLLEFALLDACALVALAFDAPIRERMPAPERVLAHITLLRTLRIEAGLGELRAEVRLAGSQAVRKDRGVELSLSRNDVELAAAQAAEFASRFDGDGWSDSAMSRAISCTDSRMVLGTWLGWRAG